MRCSTFQSVLHKFKFALENLNILTYWWLKSKCFITNCKENKYTDCSTGNMVFMFSKSKPNVSVEFSQKEKRKWVKKSRFLLCKYFDIEENLINIYQAKAQLGDM